MKGRKGEKGRSFVNEVGTEIDLRSKREVEGAGTFLFENERNHEENQIYIYALAS